MIYEQAETADLIITALLKKQEDCTSKDYEKYYSMTRSLIKQWNIDIANKENEVETWKKSSIKDSENTEAENRKLDIKETDSSFISRCEDTLRP